MSEPLPLDDQPTLVGPAHLYSPTDAPVPGPTLAQEPLPAVTPAATPAATGALPDTASELLTCPECGATQRVSLNRREAADFCQHCDYPLFWTPNRVLRDLEAGTNDLALRRLPGTVGRATIASLTCPHCAEPNALTAQTCVRCGLSLHPEAPPPAPAPVYVAPPPAPVYVEPEKHVAWWVWALVGVAFVLTVALIVLILTNTIG